MGSTATETATDTPAPKAFYTLNGVEAATSKSDHCIPLKLSGALKTFRQFDLTTVIGTQFENINLTEILHSSECDHVIRDIAITSKHYLLVIVIMFCPAVDLLALKLATYSDEPSHIVIPVFLQLTCEQSPSVASAFFLSRRILPSKIKSFWLASWES